MALEKVWLILPPLGEADDDWQPRCVFETWEQAVAALVEGENEDETEAKVEVEEDSVWLTAGEGSGALHIVAVPIDYAKEG
jgi:hypothetical protein